MQIAFGTFDLASIEQVDFDRFHLYPLEHTINVFMQMIIF